MQNSPTLAGLLASTIQIASAVCVQDQRGFVQSLAWPVEGALWWKGLHESAEERSAAVCEDSMQAIPPRDDKERSAYQTAPLPMSCCVQGKGVKFFSALRGWTFSSRTILYSVLGPSHLAHRRSISPLFSSA